MNKTALAILIGLFFFASCKKCFECHQYCAYCQSKANSALIYKTCASKSGTNSIVDSILHTYPDSLFKCTLLKDDQDVCDHKNQADDASTFFQKQDYYCYPKP